MLLMRPHLPYASRLANVVSPTNDHRRRDYSSLLACNLVIQRVTKTDITQPSPLPSDTEVACKSQAQQCIDS